MTPQSDGGKPRQPQKGSIEGSRAGQPAVSGNEPGPSSGGQEFRSSSSKKLDAGVTGASQNRIAGQGQFEHRASGGADGPRTFSRPRDGPSVGGVGGQPRTPVSQRGLVGAGDGPGESVRGQVEGSRRYSEEQRAQGYDGAGALVTGTKAGAQAPGGRKPSAGGAPSGASGKAGAGGRAEHGDL